ncbi:hypothetical protein HYX00_04960 [Candidatus Woesearchaeota archaeon]|nr:hypothetical protein [Candidatus Woesearchaeota archaeon]
MPMNKINKKFSPKLKFFTFIMLNLLLLSLLVSAQTSGKIFILTLNYKSAVLVQTLSLVDVRVGDGTPQDFSSITKGDYKLEIVASDGRTLKTINFNIPISNRQTTSGINLDFTMGIPYYSNAKTINIYDSGNVKVLEIPVDSASLEKNLRQRQAQEQAFKQFVESAAKQNEDKSTKSLIWLYIALPLLLIFGFLTYIEVKRKNDHKMLMQRVQQQSILTLKNYVTTNLRKGYSKEQIKNALVKNNYSNQDIEEAFKGLR